MSYQYKNINFDDFTESEGVWSQICQSCTTRFNIEASVLDENSGHGICGVENCSNEADHYIDFPTVPDFLQNPKQKNGYNTHGKWTTLGDIYEIEVEERENPAFEGVPMEWIREHWNVPAIWICYSPFFAHRYNVEAESMDYPLEKLHRLYPEAKECVEEIELADTMYIIDEDGDEGYLIVNLSKTK